MPHDVTSVRILLFGMVTVQRLQSHAAKPHGLDVAVLSRVLDAVSDLERAVEHNGDPG